MKRQVAWLTLAALASLAPPARAQGAAGSLTLLSRPAGASFRLAGEQALSGRTPLVLERGLVGRYEVTSTEPGYERWRRVITLDGVSADTLWMTLHPKSGAMAAARSLLVPGWGQFYGEHPARGVLFLTAATAAGVGLALTALRYQDKLDAYRDADARYQAASTVTEVAAAFEARRRASDDAEDAYQLRQIGVGVTGGIWGLAMLDAMLHVGRARGPVSLGVMVHPGRAAAPPMAALSVRF